MKYILNVNMGAIILNRKIRSYLLITWHLTNLAINLAPGILGLIAESAAFYCKRQLLMSLLIKHTQRIRNSTNVFHLEIVWNTKLSFFYKKEKKSWSNNLSRSEECNKRIGIGQVFVFLKYRIVFIDFKWSIGIGTSLVIYIYTLHLFNRTYATCHGTFPFPLHPIAWPLPAPKDRRVVFSDVLLAE